MTTSHCTNLPPGRSTAATRVNSSAFWGRRDDALRGMTRRDRRVRRQRVLGRSTRNVAVGMRRLARSSICCLNRLRLDASVGDRRTVSMVCAATPVPEPKSSIDLAAIGAVASASSRWRSARSSRRRARVVRMRSPSSRGWVALCDDCIAHAVRRSRVVDVLRVRVRRRRAREWMGADTGHRHRDRRAERLRRG